MVRFVILEHDHPQLHWDFMLEAGTVLRAWRLAAPPRPGGAITATPSFEHRLVYLDYEGPINGGRGRVVRWEHGTFVWLVDAPDRIAVCLEGEKLHGVLHLERGEGEVWHGEYRAVPIES